MSVMNEDHIKVLLPRSGVHQFWETVDQHYAQRDPRKWKYLAMLALHECAGWSLEQISRAFDCSKGHVSRCLKTVREDLQGRFRPPPDWHSRRRADARDDPSPPSRS